MHFKINEYPSLKDSQMDTKKCSVLNDRSRRRRHGDSPQLQEAKTKGTFRDGCTLDSEWCETEKISICTEYQSLSVLVEAVPKPLWLSTRQAFGFHKLVCWSRGDSACTVHSHTAMCSPTREEQLWGIDKSHLWFKWPQHWYLHGRSELTRSLCLERGELTHLRGYAHSWFTSTFFQADYSPFLKDY